MTISEYLAATALVALIFWAVLGLLMQKTSEPISPNPDHTTAATISFSGGP